MNTSQASPQPAGQAGPASQAGHPGRAAPAGRSVLADIARDEAHIFMGVWEGASFGRGPAGHAHCVDRIAADMLTQADAH